MTKRKIDHCVHLPPYVLRRHYACRIRLDLWDSLKLACSRLNCSQGVFLEIVLEKALSDSLVQPGDVFKYSSQGEKNALLDTEGHSFSGVDISK